MNNEPTDDFEYLVQMIVKSAQIVGIDRRPMPMPVSLQRAVHLLGMITGMASRAPRDIPALADAVLEHSGRIDWGDVDHELRLIVDPVVPSDFREVTLSQLRALLRKVSDQ